MYKHQVFLTLSAAIVAASMLFSCNFKKDYSTEIRQIDSLATRIDSIPARLLEVDTDTLDRINSIMEGQLEYIQQNFVGFMRQDIGKATSDYKNLKKMVKTTHTQVSDIARECEVTKKQLSDLRQALAENATHDAAGNRMDEEYVQKALSREREEAGKLIRGVPQVLSNAEKAVARFHAQYGKIEFWVDSIPAKPR